MKKFLFATLITLTAFSSQAQADGWRHRGGHHHGGGYGWVAPLVIGGAVGYALSQPRYVSPPPSVVYVTPPPTYNPPYGYHWESVLDGNCNCYRNVLVPN